MIGDIGGVVFDMDGLLFDSERVMGDAFQQALAEAGIEYPEGLYLKTIGKDVHKTRQILMEAFGDDYPFADVRARQRELIERTYEEQGMPMKEGVFEALEYFSSKDLPIAVATSTQRDIAIDHLKRGEVFPYLAAVVGGNDVSQGKPAPDIYLKAAEKLNVDPTRCIAFEDSEPGILSASAAGMRVYCIPDMIQPSPEVAEKAAGILSSLNAILTSDVSQQ